MSRSVGARHRRGGVHLRSLDVGGQRLPVSIRVDARAKRLILRLDNTGAICLTCPRERDIDAAMRMAEGRRDWIMARLAELPAPIVFADGVTITVFGQPRRITVDEKVSAAGVMTEDEIRVRAHHSSDVPIKVIRILRRECLLRCRELARSYAEKAAVWIGEVRVRDMKTRWGSCAAGGNLTFNWRLALAPPDVLTYVVAHEVAHRRHMNHSPAFWAAVASLYPGYEARDSWLRTEGRVLFRYGAPTSVD